MLELTILIIISSIFLNFSSKTDMVLWKASTNFKLTYKENNPFYLLVCLILIFFVGLRKSYNDTWNYVRFFNNLDPLKIENLDITQLGDNPGFVVLVSFVKFFISENPYVFIFITSAISLSFFFYSLFKYSTNLKLTIYLFLTSGLLLFSMAAIKQFLAMSIGFYAFQFLLKNKTLQFVLLILLASTFHTYVLIYLLAALFMKDVWSKRTISFLIIILTLSFTMRDFLEIAYETSEFFGYDYKSTNELDGNGVNVFRFIFYSITPILAFFNRKSINSLGSKLEIVFSNMSIIGWGFLFLGLFGNGNLFGRFATYFDPFVIICLTSIITNYFISNDDRKMISTLVKSIFFIFCLYDLYARNFKYEWILS